MHKISAAFGRLEDVSLHNVYDKLGVYVLWNAHSETRPSYLGEGNVLSRFVSHLGKPWALRPLGGLIWLNQESDRTEKERKWECELVEWALLAVADDVGRFPQHNALPGKGSSVRKLLERFDGRTVRLVIDGFDPLSPPERSRMRSTKRITVREHGVIEYEGWRRR